MGQLKNNLKVTSFNRRETKEENLTRQTKEEKVQKL